MLQIKRIFQFSISDLPLIRFGGGSGVTLRAMCLSGPLNALASAVRWTDPQAEVVQNGLLTPTLPLPGPPVGNAVTLSGRMRSTTTVAVPFQVVGEQIETVAAYAGSLPVPVFAPDGTFPDAGLVVLYFPDVNMKMEFEATISIYDSSAAGAYPQPVRTLSANYPRLSFRGLRLRGGKPGLASGSAQVDALTLGTVRILGLSLCVEVSGQSWIGEKPYETPDTMPWGVISEAGFEEELNHEDLSFLKPAVESGPASLPIASSDVLGGVKVGSGLSIDAAGVLAASGSGVVAMGSYDPYEHHAGDSVEIYGQGATCSDNDDVLLVFGSRVLLLTSTAAEVHTVGESFRFGGAQVKIGPVGSGVFTIQRLT